MFILKRKKKKKEKYSLPLFLSVSLNSATFGISQCLEYFTRLKKEGGALGGRRPLWRVKKIKTT